jgi:transcription elongation factor Elf1
MEFTCPYCNHATTITSPNTYEELSEINIVESRYHDGLKRGVYWHAVVCPNQECKQLSFMVSVQKLLKNRDYEWVDSGTSLSKWNLLPESNAKPQPDYIPRGIINDYNEASKILHLSPKASASLARRCLQGMIRDFYNIKKNTLNLEINELEDLVSSDVWSAIDAVRSVGNIGAHMEKDVDLIVEIEADEAELLLSLIEDLFVDWYVVRYERQTRQAKLKKLAEDKMAARKKMLIEKDDTPEVS